MSGNFKEQFTLIYNWIISIMASMILGGMFYLYVETGQFFLHKGDIIGVDALAGIFGSMVGIWLLGMLIAVLMYKAQKQYEQKGEFPKIKIPGKIFSDFYAPIIEKFQKKNPQLNAKAKAYKVFRISIVVFGCIALLGAFILRWLGIRF